MLTRKGFQLNTGRRVLITGASGGIGSAVARAFAEQGDHLLLHYFRSHDRIHQLAEECWQKGVIVHLVSADLSRWEGLKAIREAMHRYGFYPNILINNAGTGLYQLAENVTEQAWEQMIGLHLRSSFFLSQMVLPFMKRTGFGRIINVSSIWGTVGAANEVVYSTVKGGMNAMTRALAKEVASAGITVNAVAPGAIETPMNDHLTPEEKTDLAMQIPAGRLGTVQEVAALIRFLASEQAAYINGQVIGVDGAWW
ncbi:MAG: 3-oxoacyl-ACP reductase FabG [Bacillota bacterium]|nr:3-oxoacyl-ACP reductase [Bacillota bacterium]